MLQLNLSEDNGQLEDQLLLLVLLTKHGGHLLLQVADDVCVNLWEESSHLSLGLIKTQVPGASTQSS